MCHSEIYYNGHINKRKIGVGFVVRETLHRRILVLTPVVERHVPILMKAKLFNLFADLCSHLDGRDGLCDLKASPATM